MALNTYTRYAPNVIAPNANYPYGSIKDETVPGAFDGTPLTADWGNDVEGFKQAVLSEAGITPSGNADTAADSQILDGLKTVLVPKNDLLDETGSSLVGHRTQIANSITLQLSQYLDLSPLYPEQFGAVAYGVGVAAADMTIDSSAALLNAFNAAVALNRKVVLTGRYKVNSSIICHYIQSNNTSLVIEGQTAWSALVFTSVNARTMLEIHGYRPILRGFRCENTPDITGWDTKTAIKITGREGIIDSVWFRGGWKENIWGVDFSESTIVNCNGENDPFTRVGKTDNVGIGLRLNSCVNTSILNSFFGYNNYVYIMGLLESGETTDNIKPSSYVETITWGCEGIEFNGLMSVRSMHGIYPHGTEVTHTNCVIDLNKYKIATIDGVSTKFIGCWLATDSDTVVGSTVWEQLPTSSQITVDNCTFDAKDGVLPIINFSSSIQNIINNRFIKTKSIVSATLFQYIFGNTAVSVDDIILPTVPTTQTAYFYGQNLTIAKHVGQMHLGSDVFPATDAQLAVRVSDSMHRTFAYYGGDNVMSVWGHLGNTNTSGTPSAINSKMYFAHDTTSGRSINASGTINASGADYAEYMKKAEGCGDIAKGQIVGINSHGLLTDKFSESTSFCVKSTSPNLVGNDVICDGLIAPALPSNATDEQKEQHASEMDQFMQSVEFERIKWDRIAFCGQIPILVEGASAGDYVIPISGINDEISYTLTKKPTLEQFLISVGKMLNNKYLIVKV